VHSAYVPIYSFRRPQSGAVGQADQQTLDGPFDGLLGGWTVGRTPRECEALEWRNRFVDDASSTSALTAYQTTASIELARPYLGFCRRVGDDDQERGSGEQNAQYR